MDTRIGKVTNIYPSTGKVRVEYEDEKNTSMPLSMLTMNGEYSMPEVGDRVVTIHRGNGSSKGFVLGTYYGGGMQPKAASGYRKDFGSSAHAISGNGAYTLYAGTISLRSGNYHILIKEDMEIAADTVFIEGEDSHISMDTDMEFFASGNITMESEGGRTDINTPEASVSVGTDTLIRATSVTIRADDITLQCSYGNITVEEIMKRLERMEDHMGLPHTV